MATTAETQGAQGAFGTLSRLVRPAFCKKGPTAQVRNQDTVTVAPGRAFWPEWVGSILIWHPASGAYGEHFVRIALMIGASLIIGAILFLSLRTQVRSCQCVRFGRGYYCRCVRFGHLFLDPKELSIGPLLVNNAYIK